MQLTEEARALVVYTGKDSKIIMNSGKYSLKQSTLEKRTNKMLLFNLGIFLITATTLALMNYYWASQPRTAWYIFDGETRTAGSISASSFLSFYLILNLVIPLDLIVGTEL